MKSKLSLFLGMIIVLLFLESCVHAPTQSWTPRHSRKKILAKKQREAPVNKNKLHRVRMW